MNNPFRIFVFLELFFKSFPSQILFIILMLTLKPVFAESGDSASIIVTGEDTLFYLDHDDIKTGARLFYGLLPLGEDAGSCVSCHHTRPADTLSWNPSAIEIASLYGEKKYNELENVLLTPTGKKLSEVHSGYQLDDNQIIMLQGFMQEFQRHGGISQKPVIDRLLLFTGLLALLLLSVLDLLITRKIRYKVIHLMLISGSLFFITKTVVLEAIALGRQKTYQPLQPVKFSHKVHADVNGTDCIYCHHTAEYGKSAGIPSVNVCWNCHAIVREGTHSGKFEINKIVAAYEQTKEPFHWIRVHNLPDHVFFSHAQHVGAGKLDCEECHGPVKEMDVVYQFSDLSMGWCLDCHRTRRVQFMDNDYYSVYEAYHERLKTGKTDSVTAEMVGGTDCQKCHY